ncbi:M48 family metalloprotease [Halovivax sp.]|uniref:M48 family metalloprotease n=1 Tax=Halovivax sp. TaxID=1935978 RepID=UPI0025B87732|nr:M48 family metalloprotease [Halovivax sp.]
MDDRLAVRMGATLALVLAIDLCLALVAAALLEPWLGPLVAAAGVESQVATYVVLAGIALIGLLVVQLRYTRRELLAEADATLVDETEAPDLHENVTRLAAMADAPAPAVAIADTSVPNSFAVGGIGGGTIVASRGLLETLDDAELDAVLAHELAHLKNRDAAVMTVASFLPALVSDEYSPFDGLPGWTKTACWGVVAVGGYVLASTFVDAPLLSVAAVVQFVVAVGVTLVVGGVVLGVLSAAVLLAARSLSRRREFVADRAGARLAGDPAALAGALATLDEVDERPSTDKRARYGGLSGMYLLPHGFRRADDELADDDAFTVETRSHPPTEERIARLRELAATLETER